MTHHDDRSIDAIESDIESHRDRVETLIDELSLRMQPENLVDQAVGYFRRSGTPDFARNLGTTVRDNPVPVALAAVSLGWLAWAGKRGNANGYRRPAYREGYDGDNLYYQPYQEREGLTDKAAHLYDQARESVSDAVEGARERLSGAAESVRDAAGNLTEKVSGSSGGPTSGNYTGTPYEFGETSDKRNSMSDKPNQFSENYRSARDSARSGYYETKDSVRRGYDDAREGARSVAQSARESAHNVGQSLSHGADRVRAGASSAAHSAKVSGRYVRNVASEAAGSFNETIRQQPLLLGAIGLGLGAIIGASLPRTRQEDEWVGPYRDQMRDRAMDEARHQLDEAREEVRGAYEEVKSSVAGAYDEAKEKAKRLADEHSKAESGSGQSAALSGSTLNPSAKERAVENTSVLGASKSETGSASSGERWSKADADVPAKDSPIKGESISEAMSDEKSAVGKSPSSGSPRSEAETDTGVGGTKVTSLKGKGNPTHGSTTSH